MSNDDLVILLQCLEKIGCTIETYEASNRGATFTIEKKPKKKQ